MTDTLEAASSCIRSCLTASPGHELLCADFRNIEGRAQAWLAREEWKLEAFREYDRGSGPDLYELAYSRSFSTPVSQVTKAERQVGKVQELSMGYSGGISAYAKMAGNYNLDLEQLPAMVLPSANGDELDSAQFSAKNYLENRRQYAKPGELIISGNAAMACDILKQRWRKTHPSIRSTWALCEDAAIGAYTTGVCHTVGPVKFGMRGKWLHVRLPSGRLLSMFDPRMEPGDFRGDQLTFMAMVSVGGARKWLRKRTYGGDIFQSIIQGIARDLMSRAMLRLQAAGYQTVLTVHDEVGAEVPEGYGSLEEFNGIMAQLPDWATDMPIAVEGWRGFRYRK